MSCSTATTTPCLTTTNLTPLYHGDSKIINLSFVDALAAVIDLTGSTLTLTVKRIKADVTNLYQEIQTDVDMVDAAGGIVQFIIPSAETSAWDANRTVWYDILWEKGDGTIITFMQGSFDVVGTVHTVTP